MRLLYVLGLRHYAAVLQHAGARGCETDVAREGYQLVSSLFTPFSPFPNTHVSTPLIHAIKHLSCLKGYLRDWVGSIETTPTQSFIDTPIQTDLLTHAVRLHTRGYRFTANDLESETYFYMFLYLTVVASTDPRDPRVHNLLRLSSRYYRMLFQRRPVSIRPDMRQLAYNVLSNEDVLLNKACFCILTSLLPYLRDEDLDACITRQLTHPSLPWQARLRQSLATFRASILRLRYDEDRSGTHHVLRVQPLFIQEVTSLPSSMTSKAIQRYLREACFPALPRGVLPSSSACQLVYSNGCLLVLSRLSELCGLEPSVSVRTLVDFLGEALFALYKIPMDLKIKAQLSERIVTGLEEFTLADIQHTRTYVAFYQKALVYFPQETRTAMVRVQIRLKERLSCISANLPLHSTSEEKPIKVISQPLLGEIIGILEFLLGVFEGICRYPKRLVEKQNAEGIFTFVDESVLSFVRNDLLPLLLELAQKDLGELKSAIYVYLFRFIDLLPRYLSILTTGLSLPVAQARDQDRLIMYAIKRNQAWFGDGGAMRFTSIYLEHQWLDVRYPPELLTGLVRSFCSTVARFLDFCYLSTTVHGLKIKENVFLLVLRKLLLDTPSHPSKDTIVLVELLNAYHRLGDRGTGLATEGAAPLFAQHACELAVITTLRTYLERHSSTCQIHVSSIGICILMSLIIERVLELLLCQSSNLDGRKRGHARQQTGQALMGWLDAAKETLSGCSSMPSDISHALQQALLSICMRTGYGCVSRSYFSSPCSTSPHTDRLYRTLLMSERRSHIPMWLAAHTEDRTPLFDSYHYTLPLVLPDGTLLETLSFFFIQVPIVTIHDISNVLDDAFIPAVLGYAMYLSQMAEQKMNQDGRLFKSFLMSCTYSSDPYTQRLLASLLVKADLVPTILQNAVPLETLSPWMLANTIKLSRSEILLKTAFRYLLRPHTPPDHVSFILSNINICFDTGLKPLGQEDQQVGVSPLFPGSIHFITGTKEVSLHQAQKFTPRKGAFVFFTYFYAHNFYHIKVALSFEAGALDCELLFDGTHLIHQLSGEVEAREKHPVGQDQQWVYVELLNQDSELYLHIRTSTSEEGHTMRQIGLGHIPVRVSIEANVVLDAAIMRERARLHPRVSTFDGDTSLIDSIGSSLTRSGVFSAVHKQQEIAGLYQSFTHGARTYLVYPLAILPKSYNRAFIDSQRPRWLLDVPHSWVIGNYQAEALPLPIIRPTLCLLETIIYDEGLLAELLAAIFLNDDRRGDQEACATWNLLLHLLQNVELERWFSQTSGYKLLLSHLYALPWDERLGLLKVTLQYIYDLGQLSGSSLNRLFLTLYFELVVLPYSLYLSDSHDRDLYTLLYRLHLLALTGKVFSLKSLVQHGSIAVFVLYQAIHASMIYLTLTDDPKPVADIQALLLTMESDESKELLTVLIDCLSLPLWGVSARAKSIFFGLIIKLARAEHEKENSFQEFQPLVAELPLPEKLLLLSFTFGVRPTAPVVDDWVVLLKDDRYRSTCTPYPLTSLQALLSGVEPTSSTHLLYTTQDIFVFRVFAACLTESCDIALGLIITFVIIPFCGALGCLGEGFDWTDLNMNINAIAMLLHTHISAQGGDLPALNMVVDTLLVILVFGVVELLNTMGDDEVGRWRSFCISVATLLNGVLKEKQKHQHTDLENQALAILRTIFPVDQDTDDWIHTSLTACGLGTLLATVLPETMKRLHAVMHAYFAEVRAQYLSRLDVLRSRAVKNHLPFLATAPTLQWAAFDAPSYLMAWPPGEGDLVQEKQQQVPYCPRCNSKIVLSGAGEKVHRFLYSGTCVLCAFEGSYVETDNGGNYAIPMQNSLPSDATFLADLTLTGYVRASQLIVAREILTATYLQTVRGGTRVFALSPGTFQYPGIRAVPLILSPEALEPLRRSALTDAAGILAHADRTETRLRYLEHIMPRFIQTSLSAVEQDLRAQSKSELLELGNMIFVTLLGCTTAVAYLRRQLDEPYDGKLMVTSRTLTMKNLGQDSADISSTVRCSVLEHCTENFAESSTTPKFSTISVSESHLPSNVLRKEREGFIVLRKQMCCAPARTIVVESCTGSKSDGSGRTLTFGAYDIIHNPAFKTNRGTDLEVRLSEIRYIIPFFFAQVQPAILILTHLGHAYTLVCETQKVVVELLQYYSQYRNATLAARLSTRDRRTRDRVQAAPGYSPYYVPSGNRTLRGEKEIVLAFHSMLATVRQQLIDRIAHVHGFYNGLKISNGLSLFTTLQSLNIIAGRSLTSAVIYPIFPFLTHGHFRPLRYLTTAQSMAVVQRKLAGFIERLPIESLSPECLASVTPFKSEVSSLLEQKVDGDATQTRTFLQQYEEAVARLSPTALQACQDTHIFGTFVSTNVTLPYYGFLIDPYTSLQRGLQGGSLDAFSRLFIGTATHWAKVLAGGSVYEGIPDLYYSPFLYTNRNSLQIKETETLSAQVLQCTTSHALQGVEAQRASLEAKETRTTIAPWLHQLFGEHQQSLKDLNLFPMSTLGATGHDIAKCVFLGTYPARIPLEPVLACLKSGSSVFIAEPEASTFTRSSCSTPHIQGSVLKQGHGYMLKDTVSVVSFGQPVLQSISLLPSDLLSNVIISGVQIPSLPVPYHSSTSPYLQGPYLHLPTDFLVDTYLFHLSVSTQALKVYELSTAFVERGFGASLDELPILLTVIDVASDTTGDEAYLCTTIPIDALIKGRTPLGVCRATFQLHGANMMITSNQVFTSLYMGEKSQVYGQTFYLISETSIVTVSLTNLLADPLVPPILSVTQKQLPVLRTLMSTYVSSEGFRSAIVPDLGALVVYTPSAATIYLTNRLHGYASYGVCEAISPYLTLHTRTLRDLSSSLTCCAVHPSQALIALGVVQVQEMESYSVVICTFSDIIYATLALSEPPRALEFFGGYDDGFQGYLLVNGKDIFSFGTYGEALVGRLEGHGDRVLAMGGRLLGLGRGGIRLYE
ncbi:Beige/BEACH domain-containing protein [Giardia muris]|uniref:Beige/BEACH domain-containing protein n=1 Tax=Giardia muris TaxID=5742 RepID=A0A4Z1T6J2_GIAMU|nr:Beige/BEACH domain-containing protein [Giardia muris]|eukprot:TNJ28757.1 Beige/BEACH domain-containing protein [Giardia muris]